MRSCELFKTVCADGLEYLNIRGNSITDDGRTSLNNSLWKMPNRTFHMVDDKWELSPTQPVLSLYSKGINDIEIAMISSVMRFSVSLLEKPERKY